MASGKSLALTLLLFALIGLVACSARPRSQTYWVNPTVGPELQKHRYTLDTTECVALANRMIPEPLPPAQPETGRITLYAPGGPIFGNYKSQPPAQQPDQTNGPLNAFDREMRYQQRISYAAACMANRGWQQRTRSAASSDTERGNSCVSRNTKVGGKIRHIRTGQIGTVTYISGPSSRCQDPTPIRAELAFD